MLNPSKPFTLARQIRLSLPCLVLALAIATPVWAQPYIATAKKPFQLNATVDERPSLTRDDLSPVPNPYGNNGQGGQQEAGTSDNIALPEVGPGPNTVFPLQASRQEQQPQEPPQGSINEYGVDWSRWISKMADRWYFVLRNMEDQSGYQFHTVRSALINFTCYPNGQIAQISLKQSSGIDLYDRMQVQALLMTMPLHPFPQGTQRSSIKLCYGWESHPMQAGEHDYEPGSVGKGIPIEKVKQWVNWHW